MQNFITFDKDQMRNNIVFQILIYPFQHFVNRNLGLLKKCHTNKDDLNLVTQKGMEESLSIFKSINTSI